MTHHGQDIGWIHTKLVRVLTFSCLLLHVFSSRRATASGRTYGLVCVRWILGETDLSNHVGVHCKLLGNCYSLLGLDWRSDFLNGYFLVQQADTNVPLKLNSFFVGCTQAFPRDYRHIIL